MMFMSSESKITVKTWLADNLLSAVIALISFAAFMYSWANNSQLHTIDLNRKNDMLQSRLDSDARYVSKDIYITDIPNLRAVDTMTAATSAAAIAAVQQTIIDIKTDVAVIKAILQRPVTTTK